MITIRNHCGRVIGSLTRARRRKAFFMEGDIETGRGEIVEYFLKRIPKGKNNPLNTVPPKHNKGHRQGILSGRWDSLYYYLAK